VNGGDAWWGAVASVAPPAAPRSPVGPAAVLALLVLYVGLIGPVGYLVGVRPRRPLVAWGWFPAVAAFGTAGAVGASWMWEQPPTMRITRVLVLAPDGTGLETTQIHLQSAYGAAYTLTVPWEDADFAGAWPGHRFSSPISAPTGPLRLNEDTIDQVLTVENLMMGTMGMPVLSWVAPASRAAGPLLWRDGDVLKVRNNDGRPSVRGAVLIDGALARVGPLESGEEQVVVLDANPQHDPDTPYTWVDGAFAQSSAQLAWPGSARVALEYATDGDDTLLVSPSAALAVTEVVVVAGPVETLAAPAQAADLPSTDEGAP